MLITGYDTTANTILFSAIILSLNPPIQDAVISEIQQVHREAVAAGRSDLSYDEDLPKFRYLLAFMVPTRLQSLPPPPSPPQGNRES